MIDVLDGGVLFDKVNTMRLKKGWTLYELAKKSGVSATAVYHWRDRRSSPTLSLLEAVCSAFDITLIDLLTGEDELGCYLGEHQELMQLWTVLSAGQKKSVIGILRSMVSP